MKRSQSGQNVVEMAFVIPILLLLLVGVVDIGRVFNNYMSLANATREGARTAMRTVCHDTATGRTYYLGEIRAAVLQEISGHPELFQDGPLAATDITITPVALTTRCPNPAEDITVAISYSFRFWMGDLIGLNAIPLNPSTTVRVYVWEPTPVPAP